MFTESKYNYFIPYQSKTLCFNAISKTAFILQKNEMQFLQKSLNNLEDFKEKYTTYFAFLLKQNFIIHRNFCEYDYILFLRNKAIFLDNKYKIIINPTMECNFNCWYCYEDHPQGYMSNEVKNKIINHIKLIPEIAKISELSLSWFGGEPLLYFNEIVYPIAKTAKKIMDTNKISFSNQITTNGFLINENMIAKFRDIDLNYFQITLDGIESDHNKVRNQNGTPSYKWILSNIKMLLKSSPSVHVTIRINYTDKSLINLEEIFNDLEGVNKKQIQISFNRVWQTLQKSYSLEVKNNISNIFELAIKSGFKCNHPSAIPDKIIPCYVSKYRHTEINYDGSVYKCSMDYSNSQGQLLDNGEIIWNKEVLSSMFANPSFENEMCKACKLLPICGGPCPKYSLEKTTSNIPLIHQCRMRTSEINTHSAIINYFEMLKQKNKTISESILTI